MSHQNKQGTNDIIKNSGSDRYTVFPIKYESLWSFYKKHLATFWTAEEIKLTDDITDWKDRLNDNERYFIKNILAFFAASDGIVNENLVVNFYNEVQIPEARQFYAVQIMLEAIHSETYSLLIDTYISNKDEKLVLLKAVENIPCIKKKADWAIKWINTFRQDPPEEYTEALSYFTKKQPSFPQRLLAFICVEGIFFSGSFCAIYWLKNRGLMPGLSTANQFISRDENLHTEFAISLYQLINDRLDEQIVHGIFKEAVTIEKEFITESLPVSLIGMNCKLMSEYIEMVADRWLVLLGYNKIYNTQNPFPFMELISLNEKVNFFENTVTNYQRSNVGTTEQEREISFDCDDF